MIDLKTLNVPVMPVTDIRRRSDAFSARVTKFEDILIGDPKVLLYEDKEDEFTEFQEITEFMRIIIETIPKTAKEYYDLLDMNSYLCYAKDKPAAAFRKKIKHNKKAILKHRIFLRPDVGVFYYDDNLNDLIDKKRAPLFKFKGRSYFIN